MGNLNPFRYRGYVYDAETGLYYVTSRYYDPEIGRWINSDNMITTGSDLAGLNLFAYCGNNPVNRVDPSGRFWISAIIKTVVVVAATIAKVVYTVKETKRVQEELDTLPEPTADISESFRKTLRDNANTVKETTKNKGIIESGKQFYNKVRNKGEWDLKQLPEYQGTFRFNNLVIQGQDIGNINFGYTGKALGLPDSVLLAGAGFAQIKAGTSNFSFIMASNGDDLRDQIYAALEHMCVSEETIEILTFDRYAICLDQYGIVGCTVIFPTKGNRWKALPMHAFRRLFRCVGDARRNKLHILLFEHGGDILVFGELHSQESEEIFTDSTARSYPTYVYYESGSASQIPFFKHCTFFTLAELEAGYSIAAGEDSIDFDGTQWSYDLNGNPVKINCATCWGMR